jgi:hypothetical protein
MPDLRPVRTISPATALTSSLCHVAVMKSGSASTDNRGPLSVRASRPAAGTSGSTSRTGVRSRTQPSGCVSAENQTTHGTTVDSGQCLLTRSTCSTPFCSARTTVFASHSRASQAAAASFWVSFTASSTMSTGPLIESGSVRTGPGTTMGSPSSGLSSMDSRGVRPQRITGWPSAWTSAAIVEPMAPGPTSAMLVSTIAKLPVGITCGSSPLD